MTEYRAVLTGPALRNAESLSPRVVEPLLAFIFGGLVRDPRRRGKPIRGDLAGLWSARRGDYRIMYRLDDATKTLYVLKIGGRADIYRP